MTNIVVLLSIIFNSILNVVLLSKSPTLADKDAIVQKVFWPFKNMRYGYWLAKRWLLPIVAVITLIPWLSNKGRIWHFFNQNRKYILLILTFLVVARILSFSHWFYLDDFRFLGDFLKKTVDIQKVPCCGEGFPAQWMIYLVMRWFGTNFYLYNLLGLVTYLLIGICIFAIGNKIQKNKFVSLLAALFFVTTPTYFHATIAMVDFTGDGFSLLLFAISLYFLLNKSISRCLIFAAASLEFGLSRTHFIALPLILVALINRKELGTKPVIITITSLILISLPYYPILAIREANQYHANTFFFNLNNFLISTNAITHALVPFSLLKFIGLIFVKFSNSYYLSPVIGSILLLFLIGIMKLVPKLFLLGGSIIICSLVFPPMFGVRTDRNPTGFTRELIANVTPLPATGYGLFPAFGLTLILLNAFLLIDKHRFKKTLFLIIIFNMLTFIYSDFKWNEIHVNKDKATIAGLNNFLPHDNNNKVIFLDRSAYVIRHNILVTLQVYWPNENVAVVDDPNDPILGNGNIYAVGYNGQSNNLYEIPYKPL